MPKKNKGPVARFRAGKDKTNVRRITPAIENEARDIFVQGTQDEAGNISYPTIKGLATKLNISLTSLTRRIHQGGWMGEREAYTEELRRLKDEKKRKELVDQAVDFDSGALLIAKALHSQVGDILNIAQRETSRLRGNTDEKVGELDPHGTYRYLSNSALCQLANVSAQAQTIGRLAVGQSTENMNVSGTQEIRHEVENLFGQLREIARQSGKVPTSNPVIEHIP
tara:strand:- start:1190 stop:1864 length:675 start_codon:yes stop_codon:yes gene_type:complete